MTGSTASISDVVEAFASWGFLYHSRTSGGNLKLMGDLRTAESSHPCEILISSDFSEPPAVRLLQIPERLLPIAPHINSSGSLCYLSKSSISLNIFDPVGQMHACIKRAEFVLEQILRGEVVDDLAEEFFAYWGASFFHCFFDIANDEVKALKCLIGCFGKARGGFFFVTDNVTRTALKTKTFCDDATTTTIPVFRVRTRIAPRPSMDKWPVVNVGDLLRWQSSLDPRASKNIEARIAQLAERGERIGLIIVDAPKYKYCFAIFIQKNLDETYPTVKQLRKKTVLYRSSVLPLRGWRIDESYITQRNIPNMKTLAGKKIVLVGCGTIGGYLADMLVKAGAGAGGGQLLLVDNDSLHASNLGRHRLGFPHLLQNKATALTGELITGAPDAVIKALPVDVRTANLGAVDLLIDATGEEAIGSMLISKYGRKTSQLSIWIEGPGVVVRGLLRSSKDQACTHCLTQHNQNGNYRATIEEIPRLYEGQGCEQEYVPFPATVSVYAACLGCEMALAWVAGKATMSLRTRVVDDAFTLATPDCNLERIEGCPACST